LAFPREGGGGGSSSDDSDSVESEEPDIEPDEDDDDEECANIGEFAEDTDIQQRPWQTSYGKHTDTEMK